MINAPLTTCLVNKSWRIISSRFPPVAIFEEIAVDSDFAALYELESRTNERLRQEKAKISLVAEDECVYGPGAGYIMAAFTHLNPMGSRFSDGSYGVYYAAGHIKTAIEETKFHTAEFLLYTAQKQQELDMRVLTARINGQLHDITSKNDTNTPIYNQDNHSESQKWSKSLKQENADGIIYTSLRHNNGTCYALLRPKTLSNCKQQQHLRYCWDGREITQVYEMRAV